MSWKGTSGPTLVREDRTFTHGQGWSFVLEFAGSDNQMNQIVAPLAQAGYEVDVTGEPPFRTLIARKQAFSDLEFQEFYDRFSITKEVVEKDIFSLLAVQDEIASAWIPNTGSPAQEYVQLVKDSVDECDTSLLPNAAVYPVAWQLHNELVKGVEVFEDEYIVLSRERVVGINYATPLVLPQRNISTIYTTAQLQSVFAIPNFIGVAWPAPTANAPSASQWGWRSRSRRIEWVEGQKVIITEEWAWAAWSTYLYTVYSP